MATTHRLRKHADYQHAYAGSRRQFTKQMAYFVAPRPPERRSATAGPRIGLTVPKALGKAHDRNRIKRRLRSAVAAHLALLTAPVDIILHPRRSVLTVEYAVLGREIAGIFRSVQSSMARSARSTGIAPNQSEPSSQVAIPFRGARQPPSRTQHGPGQISSAVASGSSPADPAPDLALDPAPAEPQ